MISRVENLTPKIHESQIWDIFLSPPRRDRSSAWSPWRSCLIGMQCSPRARPCLWMTTWRPAIEKHDNETWHKEILWNWCEADVRLSTIHSYIHSMLGGISYLWIVKSIRFNSHAVICIHTKYTNVHFKWTFV